MDGDESLHIVVNEATDDPIEIDDPNICLNGNTELKQTKAIDPHIDPQPEVAVDEVDNEPDAQFQDVPAPTVQEPIQAPTRWNPRSAQVNQGPTIKKYK